jgi:hypothetical protein
MFKSFRVDKAEIVKMFGGGEVSGDTEFFAVPKPVLDRVRNHMDAYTIEKKYLSGYKKTPIETASWSLWDVIGVTIGIGLIATAARWQQGFPLERPLRTQPISASRLP